MEVLQVDDLGGEVVDLPEQDLLARRLDGQPVLPCPGGLERRAVDDHLVSRVAELPEVVRVGVGGAEERVHQRAPLLLVRATGEPFVPAVVGGLEGRVTGIDDQDAHREARRGYLHSRRGRPHRALLAFARRSCLDARPLPARRDRARAGRAEAGSRRRCRADGRSDRRRVQRGVGDRQAAREPARAGLPAGPDPDRRLVGRIRRSNRGDRARVPRRQGDLEPAWRQGRRSGSCRSSDRERDRRVHRRELDLGLRRAATARSTVRRSRRRLRLRAAAHRRFGRREPGGRLLALRARCSRRRVPTRVGHGRQRIDLRGSPVGLCRGRSAVRSRFGAPVPDGAARPTGGLRAGRGGTREGNTHERDRVPAQGPHVRALLADRRSREDAAPARAAVRRGRLLAPPPALRVGNPARRPAGHLARADRAWLHLRPRARRAARAARSLRPWVSGSRATTSSSRGRRSSHSGTTCDAASLRRGRRRRAHGEPRSRCCDRRDGSGRHVTRACNRRAGGEAGGWRAGSLPANSRRQGRCRLRVAEAPHDGRRRGEARRGLRGRSRRRPNHTSRPDPAQAVTRRAAAALERGARRDVGDRAASHVALPGRAVRRAPVAPARREARHHRLGADPRTRVVALVGAHRARPLVRAASRLEDRSADPPADAARAVRRHVQGRDRRLAGRQSRPTTRLRPCPNRSSSST